MPGPVSFETMVTFVRQEVADIVKGLDELTRKIGEHDAWHRGHLEEQLRQRLASRPSWASVAANWTAVIVAVVAVIVATTHGH